ncbi:MAG: hypothetical protein WD716_06150 [Fimbriimonadaceae bacterium]
MSKSPYPRHDDTQTSERKYQVVRSWFLYVTGTAFVVFGVAFFFMSPSQTSYNVPDFLTGLFFVALGIAARASGQARLSQLKGLSKADRTKLLDVALWLPWYLRQPHRPTQQSFEDPPPPTK